MRKYYYLIFTAVLWNSSFAQETTAFDQSFDPIRAELEEWDPIRGPWLSSSLEAMSKQEPIPDRTFPEDITPSQMVNALPTRTRDNVERFAQNEVGGEEADQEQWREVQRVLVRPGAGCSTHSARTYGDPHINTFDGARYSFQTVGEFVLAKSTASGIEVQARQKPQREDFSLNTAIAMNVGGDRVGVYAEDLPDANSSPVRVNGLPVVVSSDKAYFLRNGGTIRKSGRTYTISWPTGENVVAQMRNSGGMSFMNVTVQITDCSEGNFDGLMGNANGRQGDDFQGMNDIADLNMGGRGDIFGVGSRELEQQRLSFLANTLADKYRVTPMTTLFDYPMGTSTHTFTDRSFPRVHRTMSELTDEQRMNARNTCEQQGVSSADMNGCIFDNAHLGLPPSRPIEIEDPSQGIVFEPIKEERPNVNRPESEPTIQEVNKDTEVKPRLTPMPVPDSKPRKETEAPTNTERESGSTWEEPARETETETEESSGSVWGGNEEKEESSGSGWSIFGGSSGNSGSSSPTPVRSNPTPVRTSPSSRPTRTTPTSTPKRTSPTRSTGRGGR